VLFITFFAKLAQFVNQSTMKRRSFVKASILTAASGAALPLTGMAMEANQNKSTMFYELRVYSLKDQQQQTLVERYFKDAAIPALNRLGSKNIGVFTESKPEGQSKLFVLIPYRSLADYSTIEDKLAADKAYMKAGETYLNAPSASPAYERIESSLLKAFAHMPTLEVPSGSPKLFELRRYEHATESAGKKKIDMFNNAGEIDIFKRLDFKPVFFGETLIGENRPNLIYMVAFDNMEAHGARWKAFGSDPEWKKVSARPEFADAKLVSKITSTFLAPSAVSQI
jgi:hypothetical protein